MSLDFQDAPMCKGERCTHLLTSRVDAQRNYCQQCWWDMQEVSQCLMCNEWDTYTTNGDVGWCSECHTVEGDWRWITNKEHEELES